MIKNILLVTLFFLPLSVGARNFFINPSVGNDNSKGTFESPFKSLKPLKNITLEKGDTVFLAGGQVHRGSVELKGVEGSKKKPIVVTSYLKGEATIDAKGFANGVLVENSSYVKINNLTIEANGGAKPKGAAMRCGVLITATKPVEMGHIDVTNLKISKVYQEKIGFSRPTGEVKTANGTQSYGWGIRVINKNDQARMKDIAIRDCDVSYVSHTGIKFTGNKGSQIENVEVTGCNIQETGGPGMQFSRVREAYIANNYVFHSGSELDSRHWGRGSGMWTWSVDNFLIERNSFIGANGPGDSAGAHIDYHCNNVILQYNLSANNAGGFVEILGNCHNCCYRYNISVNDGYRVKGKDGAFQEGKTLWLSGFVGENAKRNGPYNSYVYNNTIFVGEGIEPKMAIENTAHGALIANNIFYVKGETKVVPGDQYKPEKKGESEMKGITITNNLYLHNKALPSEYKDLAPIIDNPRFANGGTLEFEDYIPLHKEIIQKGIKVEKIEGDKVGVLNGLNMKYDFAGKQIKGNIIGALQ